MKAVRLTKIGQPLELQEVPLPRAGERDVLVRVRAAGICHSDVHYRAGISPVGTLPQTLGHEIAGIVEETGSQVRFPKIGDRVCIHYQLNCGDCNFCVSGNEQFCKHGMMIGKHCDGGYAEYVAVPARNTVLLPDEVSFEEGAILMCSSATSYHALKKVRLKAGETVAVFGAGGLGISAIQLARIMGALDVYSIDINKDKLKLSEKFGAIPINAAEGDPVSNLFKYTNNRGVDVALEVIGLPQTMRQAVKSMGVFGRTALVGITDKPFEIFSYQELLGKEAEVIGCSDHLLSELPLLVEFVRRKKLDLSHVITKKIPLDASLINEVMDDMEAFGGEVRVVICP
ncbi:MAG: zinc-binding dehydrogenase [Candidatus Atribacteria bacterium]|nr:zinc-binding dehydrogenase [Candidatus Atribacteria bacterium]